MLVNVAGGSIAMPAFEDMTDEAWNEMLDLNLTGAMRCIRAALPHLRQRPSAAIVSISSVNGLAAFGEEAYSSAKAGLGLLTRNLAVKLGPAGIRVNAVAPGTVRTRVWDGQDGGADRLRPLYPARPGRRAERHRRCRGVPGLRRRVLDHRGDPARSTVACWPAPPS